jgi:hypothetical protein
VLLSSTFFLAERVGIPRGELQLWSNLMLQDAATLFDEIKSSRKISSNYLPKEEIHAYFAAAQLSDSTLSSLMTLVAINKSHILDKPSFIRVFLKALSMRDNTPLSDPCAPVIDVFLGGTCGNSTWRIAVMEQLDAAGVSYYNPQVKDWTPALMSIEAIMKLLCRATLFVIDGSTRAIVSLIEIAELSASGSKLIVCIDNMKEGCEVDGVTVGKSELKDCNRGRSYATEIAKQNGSIVVSDTDHAVKAAVDLFFPIAKSNQIK